ncbi:MAG: leucine-rich repeat domain-containing protein, partial [Ureaplasma sp.]|nr:leucine-rich repeat domain-containing protein [Ureaplasma sp.]
MFNNCTNFTKLIFASAPISSSKTGELVLPASLLNTTWPSADANTGVFANSAIKEVEFSQGITINELPQYIFCNMSNLTTITNLPKTIKVIQQYAFYNTAITTFDDKNGWSALDNLLKIGQYAFAYCTNLKTVKVSNPNFGLDYDANYVPSTTGVLNNNQQFTAVFQNCYNLEIANFGATRMSAIGNSAFEIEDSVLADLNAKNEAPKLTTVSLPDCVWWYGTSCFKNQTNLMNLPNLGNTNIIGLTNNASTNIDGVYFVNNCFTNTGFTKISVAEINSTGARNAAAGELVLPNIENTKLEFRGSDFTNMTKLT